MTWWAWRNVLRRYWPSALAAEGLLGMNRRNAEYLLPLNPRGRYPLVDDKLKTKQICQSVGIPAPETYWVVRQIGQLRSLVSKLAAYPQFVVKPARGAEGRGIVVVAAQEGPDWRTPRGQRLGWDDLAHHIANILSGLYSLSGLPDVALVEQRILPHPAFADLAVEGTPDVRIVLYRHVPVMAMLRLPTRTSHGRANLHQGAVGVGVDLTTGRTTGGVCRNRTVNVHPDTGAPLEGHRVPYWQEVLLSAMRLADQLQLGYLGVDFVLDASVGSVVLEANARPGLAIQLANRCGLLPRLQWVEDYLSAHTASGAVSVEERLDCLKSLASLK